MTCKEKLKREDPLKVGDDYYGGCANCPSTYGYLEDPEYCNFNKKGKLPGQTTCRDCWERELPEIDDATSEEVYQSLRKECTKLGMGEFKCDICGYRKGLVCRCEVPCNDYDQYKPINEIDVSQPHKTKVICISGKARHGKDTTAGFLKEALEARGKKVLITHYGDLVKYVCKTFFDWNGEKDEAGRTLLQYIGTDVIRAQTPNYWVDFVLSILKHFPYTWDYVLIPDCRFPNEIECVKNAGWDMMHIRVVRSGNGFVSPLTEEQQNHISETALDDAKPDFRILNYGTLDDLSRYIGHVAGYLEKN